MRKILLAIDSSTMGGAQKVFQTCVDEFLRRNCKIVVVVSDGSLAALLKANGVNCYIVNYSSLKSLWAIFKILKAEKHVLINSYLTKCSLFFAFVNLFYNNPICCTLLNAIIHEKLNAIQKNVYPFFYYLLYRMCDGIIVNSEQNRKHFLKVAKMKSHRVKVIYSGIDTVEARDISTPLKTGDEFVIGVVGRLSLEKGHCYLIDALKNLREIDYKCIIVGDGPLRNKLERQVIDNKLQGKVEFLGFRTDITQLMSQMDVVVVPSLNETFGISIVEAFALKKAVVASDVGGIPELVKHNVTGLLFPAKDSTALAEKLIYLNSNKEETSRMGKNGYEFAMRNFTSEIMVTNTLNYYKSLPQRRL